MEKKHIMFADRVVLLITTLFGVGYTPLCPGTAACVVALIVVFLIPNPVIFFSVTVVSLVLAFGLAGRAERIIGTKDATQIVIDDFAGLLVTFLFIPHDIRFIIAGFFLFRMFDMLKIPPANKIEKVSGALGVVGDDLIAGIYANILLRVVSLIVK